ncbi:LytR/AlgR family response regulator transcription factor [Niabella beijingensis]|uniref:LytR/AlgR family response regulator transcription factor n=1 Tax=Niabella beijingensis TaxID=2872700 RepID=UPI001CC0BD3B|nr:LytTR family DNA-binding domain-containing protein [Niabella beijingensis]MBZ4187500.1 LytTR family DNA-binding domain-containing protein [Niabella beijingensis]
MKLKCVIVDDEPLAREILAGFLAPLQETILCGSFGNASDALRYLKAHPVDALFLDIEMPEMSGIELLQQLPQPPVTVFTTAFRNYAFEGFELGVIDFLLKPISRQRFGQALERVTDFLALQKQEAGVERDKTTPEFIFVKSGVEKIKLILADVIFIQGLKDYAIIHTAHGKTVVKGSVKSMQELFAEPAFIRVHKSFIVAADHIHRMTRNRIIISHHLIPIGRMYREQLEQKLSGNNRQ